MRILDSDEVKVIRDLAWLQAYEEDGKPEEIADIECEESVLKAQQALTAWEIVDLLREWDDPVGDHIADHLEAEGITRDG